MAKFLPFIVESSTPLYVYQTILSRSKGINDLTVVSIFNLVLKEGIKKIRDVVSFYSDSFTLLQIYTELLRTYPMSIIAEPKYSAVLGIKKFVFGNSEFTISPELTSNYEDKDTLLFLLGLIENDMDIEEYTSIPLKNLFKEEAKEILNNLPSYDLFSSTSDVKWYFSSKEELIHYIHYHTLISTESDQTVQAIYTGRS